MSKAHSPARQVAISRGLCCVEDIDLLQDIVTKYQPQVTVIIGAGSGTMSLGFLECRNQYQQLISVDISEDNLEWERRAWVAGHWGERPILVAQIPGDSSEVGREYSYDLVDFLVIDGDHSGDGVRKDLEAWLPKLNSSAVIMLHDYDADIAPEKYPGVKVAADELLAGWQFQGKRGWSAWWTRSE